MQDKEIDFVVSHFRDDALQPEANWRRFMATVGLRRGRVGVAAAVAAIIVVTATAGVFSYREFSTPSSGHESWQEVPHDIPSAGEPKLMVFEASGLAEVVYAIEGEYGVRIGNVPPNADEYVLTLRYEGTPEELIEAINEILGTQLTVDVR